MSLVELTIGSDKIAELILNRPEKLNAFSAAMVSELTQKIGGLNDVIARGDAHVVILRSAAAPKAFCAGADLGERVGMNVAQVSDTIKTLRVLMDAVAAIAVPVIAVIDGIAFGGGLELALCCDLRVATPTSQMGLTETRLAIIPGAGGTQRLRALLGEAKAKELILLAKKVSAEEALKLGLVNQVSADALGAAKNWAREMLACGPLALMAAKKAIEGYRADSFSGNLDFERQCYERVLNSEDRVEGLRAFMAKQNPVYKGR